MSPRPRGRPRGGGGGQRRDQILEAARARFAREGFDGASLRSIAVDAGVDPALVSHYFGTKSGLLAASLELPFDPAERILGALAGPVEGAGERVLTMFLTSWDAHPDAFATIVRTGLSGTLPIASFTREVLVAALLTRIEGEDAALRAGLVVSQAMGLGVQRWVLGLDPVASARTEDLVRWFAPSMQRLIAPG